MLGSATRVCVNAFSHGVLTVKFVSKEFTRFKDLFASDDDNALTAEEFFSNIACKTALEMGASIYNDFPFEHA